MGIKIDKELLRKDLEKLADDHGLILDSSTLEDLTDELHARYTGEPSKTVYVVSWTPKDVGGFDWFWDRLPAEQCQEAYRVTDPSDMDVRLEEVEIPAVLGQNDAEEITSWLEGFWYDR